MINQYLTFLLMLAIIFISLPGYQTTTTSNLSPSPMPSSTVADLQPSPTPTQSTPHLSFTFEPVGQLGGPIKDVVIADDVAYLAVGLTLTVLDISSAANPTLVTEIPLPNLTEDLHLVIQPSLCFTFHVL